jgi:hypothetical protein
MLILWLEKEIFNQIKYSNNYMKIPQNKKKFIEYHLLFMNFKEFIKSIEFHMFPLKSIELHGN